MEDASRDVCTSDPGRIYKNETDDKMFYGCGENKCCQRIKPTINRKFGIVGQFESTVNNRRIFPFDKSIVNINGLAVSADVGPPRFGTLQSSPIFTKFIQSGSVPRMPSNRFWVWDSDDTKTRVVYNFIIPVSFLEPTFPALDGDICPSGPLISLAESYDNLRAGPCSKIINGRKQGPGTYTTECAQSLFLQGGCEREGKGYPTDAQKMDDLLNDVSKTPIIMEDIIENVGLQRIIATRPYDSKTDLERLKEANMYCFGKFEYNPCSGPLEKSGPQDPVCLDFLFQNAGKSTPGVGPTYTQSSTRSSGSGKDIAHPILYCQRNGSIAPIGKDGKPNLSAINMANTFGSISNIKNFYDSIHRLANFSKSKEEQSKAMKQCYGVTVKADGPEEDITKIADGKMFGLIPALSPGSKIINLNGSAVGQTTFSNKEMMNATRFQSKRLDDGTMQIISTIQPNGGIMAIDGFNAKFSADDGSIDFKERSSWKVVESISGNPGEVSFQTKGGFYLFYNTLTRALAVNNKLDEKNAFSFFVN
jgi:hypothetical protein